MRVKNPLTGRKGMVLLTTIIILAFLAVLGMSLIAILFSRISYSEMEEKRLKALYLAESGIAKALWELRHDTDPDDNGQGNIAKTPLGDGYYRARHDFQNSILTATGDVDGVKRVVQLKYRAL